MSIHQLQSTVIRLSDYLHSRCVFTIIHTISGNLQNNDYQKKESIRDEWAFSAIGYFCSFSCRKILFMTVMTCSCI